jgi:hypothetical protein
VKHQSALELIGDLPSALSYDGINPHLPPQPWPVARRRRGGGLVPIGATVKAMILALPCGTPPDTAMIWKRPEALLVEVTRRGFWGVIVDDTLDAGSRRLFTCPA